tara:strand:+ start:3340 stop:4917 length:1578 start_codon:yes stop_codon:yes gene_type:complete
MAYNIGDTGPGGGTIFFVPIPGVNDFYYEIAPVDIGTATYPQNTSISPNYIQPCSLNREPGFEFGSKGVSLGTSMGFGDGKNNTDLICAAPSGGSTSPPNPVFDINKTAAQACKSWVYGGKSDWFLPSMTEMLAANQNVVCNWTNRGAGTYKYYTDEYWTSSEYGYKAFAVNFLHPFGGTNYTGVIEKCHTRSVRAIRRFLPGIDFTYRTLQYPSPCDSPGCIYPWGNYSNEIQKGKSPGAISWIFGSDPGAWAYQQPSIVGAPNLLWMQHFRDANNNHLTQSPGGWGNHTNSGLQCNIKIYDWNENLVGEWTYEYVDGFTCSLYACQKECEFELVADIMGTGPIDLVDINGGPYYIHITNTNNLAHHTFANSEQYENAYGLGKNLRGIDSQGNPNTALFAGYSSVLPPSSGGWNNPDLFAYPFYFTCRGCGPTYPADYEIPWVSVNAPNTGSQSATTWTNNPNDGSTSPIITFWNTVCSALSSQSMTIPTDDGRLFLAEKKRLKNKKNDGTKEKPPRKSFKRKK